MLGIFLNLIMIVSGVCALIFSIAFFSTGGGRAIYRSYTLTIGIETFLINTGYALMSFTPDLSKAWIPRIFGLFGIDFFLLTEVSFLLADFKTKKSVHIISMGLLSLYAGYDLIIHGSPTAMNYIRFDNLFTGYESASRTSHLFHYSYVIAVALTMFSLGIAWYKKQTTKHDKIFSAKMIGVNLVVAIEAIPDIIKNAFALRHPSFFYCIGFSTVFFVWYFAVKKQAAFVPTIKNTAAEVFGVIDLPILILDLDGKIELFNPAAMTRFRITREVKSLREILALSDVDILRLSAKARRGEKSEWQTRAIAEILIAFSNAT